MREDSQLVDRALRVHDQRVDELGGRTNLGCSPRTPEALWEHELGALEQCSLCDLSNGGVSGVPVAGEGWRVHRHWPTGALTDSSHGLCARSGKKKSAQSAIRGAGGASLPESVTGRQKIEQGTRVGKCWEGDCERRRQQKRTLLRLRNDGLLARARHFGRAA